MKIKDILPEYFRYLKSIGKADRTILNAGHGLRQFIRFLKSEGITDIDDLSNDILSEYQQELAFRLTPKGNMLTLGSQMHLLGLVKVFTRYLKTEDYLLNDPSEKIRLPKLPKRLPKVILTQADIKKLLSACEKNNRGYRNRVIIELLYDTAVRRAELSHIKIMDMDLSSGYIHVTGKGSKDRVVPLSQRVCGLVQEYILQIRPMLLGDRKDKGYLILSHHGSPLSGDGILYAIKQTCKSAGIKKKVTTHTFRHTCVTHMLRNGAPIRHLQQMLGHESLESTQIYTHVTINDLKEVHAKYHPSGSTDI